MFILVCGASGSGKSKIAEELAVKHKKKKYYIATMYPDGEEAQKKILKHKLQRKDKGFITLEIYNSLEQHINKIDTNSVVLIECIGNLISNEMFRNTHDLKTSIASKIFNDIVKIYKKSGTVILVSNDVFKDICNYSCTVKQYMKSLAELNIMFAQKADIFIEAIYGNAYFLKSKNKLY